MDPAQGTPSQFDRGRVESFLRELGADRLAHPGGTLLAHVRRVADLVAAWGGDEPAQAAALCHACYGTDGFPHALLGVDERPRLADLIGAPAESQVYRYGSCDRRFAHPQFGGSAPVAFRDRLTGEVHTPDAPALRAFAELTAANEVDVMAHDARLAAEHGAGLMRLFTRMRGLLTGSAWQACVDLLGGPDVGSPTPHARRPTPGSADLCLITTATPGLVLAHLAAEGVAAESGPVPRAGAVGPIASVHFRDPDGNLIEVSTCGPDPAG